VTSAVAFSLVHLAGDPATAMAGENAAPEDVEAIRRVYGLDRPLPEQYLAWLAKVASGDLGRSHYLRAGVAEVLAQAVPVTATLALAGLGFALLLSIPLGVLAALAPNTPLDRFALWLAVFGQAVPSFLFGLGLIYLFGVVLRWLPISGGTTWQHFVLPAVALGYYATPAIMRLTRSSMIEVMRSHPIRTARAIGVRPLRLVTRHALRNAMVPVVSLAAVQLGFMLGGSVIVETVFSLKGVGYLAYQSIQRSDIEVIQAILLMIALTYAVLTLAADILNALLDPRLRVR
jgi:peptide/nickel transport system permease protein